MIRLLTAVFLLLTLTCCGQTKQGPDKDKERIDKVCDEIMQTIAAGKFEDALQLLKQNTVISSSTIDTLQATMIEQINNVFPAYGKMLSSEFIREFKVKEFIAKRFYILKFEKYYLKFDFLLYNNGKNWTITNFNYNEDLTEVLF